MFGMIVTLKSQKVDVNDDNPAQDADDSDYVVLVLFWDLMHYICVTFWSLMCSLLLL